MKDTLKVLVVDDTIVYRQILSNLVSDMKDVELSGTAPNGKIALSKINLSPPDLVLLDVSMPVMDGIETLKILRKDYPDIDVIMISGADIGNANLTMKALNLGALDFIPKPRSASPEESVESLASSLSPLMTLVKTRKYSRRTRDTAYGEAPAPAPPAVRKPVSGTVAPVVAPPVPRPVAAPRVKREIGRIDVVGIGVSTGGPNALQHIIPLIEADLKVPILAVQHMPPTFTASLAERLDKDSKISVVEGREGDVVRKGTMYIAPGGYHMVVRKRGERFVLGVTSSPPVNSCRPSIDVLFRSMAMAYGGNILTVVLTGMGNDGAAGVGAIRRKGGYSIVQDEETCVVWGMPQAVYAAGEADEVLPLEKIARRIMDIAGRG